MRKCHEGVVFFSTLAADVVCVYARSTETWEIYGVKIILKSCLNTYSTGFTETKLLTHSLIHFIVTMHINLHYIDGNLWSSLV